MSVAWKTNKVVSILAYGWLVLGIVWVVNAGSCQLSSMCMFLEAAAMLKFFVTWILFQYLLSWPHQEGLAQQEFEDGQQQHQQQQGASWELIDSIPIIEQPPLESDESEESCVVCLNEFVEGQALRQLPCSHRFHQHCIDKWLSRRKVCPLCLQDIESPTHCSTKACCEKKDA